MSTLLADLRRQIGDHLVYSSTDSGFDQQKKGWNQAIQHEPHIIVTARTIEHITRTVQVCNVYDIPVGVRNSGHGGCSIEQGVMIDVSRLNQIRFVPGKQVKVYAQCGAFAGSLIDTLATRGFMLPTGSGYHIGLSGLTSGGGIGWLVNSYGPLVRYVESFAVVLSDGQLHTVSPNHHPGLFKSLCGGGHTAGVVAEIQFGNLLKTEILYGGYLRFDPKQEDPLRLAALYDDWVATLPKSGTTSLAIVRTPEGKPFIEIRGCFLGGENIARRHIRNWEKLRFVENSFKQMRIQDIWGISRDGKDPIPVGIFGGDVLTGLDIPTIVYYSLHHPNAQKLGFIEFRDIGRMPEGRNDQSFTLGDNAKHVWMCGGHAPDEQVFQEVALYAQEFSNALAYKNGTPYLNFLELSEMQRCRDLPSEVRQFHSAIKSEYDPNNRFQFNYSYRRMS